MIKKRHFEIHGHFNEIISKKRRFDEQMNSIERFFDHVDDKLDHCGFTGAMNYILNSLKTARKSDRLGYKLVLTNALDHFSPKQIIRAFTVDFANDQYFAGDATLSTIPLNPKLAFISGFCDFFLDKVMFA